jgi:DoxX-like family
MKPRTIYRITTISFAVFMAFTAIPDIFMMPDAVKFIEALGYPNYFIPFIGVAKLLGSAALLIPGFPRIREWAYAGLFFDLIGAVYSNVMTHGLDLGMLTMIPIFGFGIASYIYHHRMMRSQN